MSVLVLLLVFAASLCGQTFQSLATTEDGSVLYFSSPARLVGSDSSYNPKIFRWDAANGFGVAAEQRERGEFDGCNYANFFQFGSPSVSADGTSLAYTASRPVVSNRFCSAVEPSVGLIRSASSDTRIDGITTISRNGRYAISAPSAAVASRYHLVTDLTTGAVAAVAGPFNGSWQSITDEGAVIATERNALVLTERNGLTRLFRTQYSTEGGAVIDRAGRNAVYVTPFSPSGPARITSVDLTTGRETEVFSGFSAGQLSLTSDGSAVLFIDRAQLYVAAGTVRQLTNETDSVVTAIVSGNGRIAYAVTGTSRLLRIDLSSGTMTELAPPAPALTGFYRLYQTTTDSVAAGNIVQPSGSGLRDINSLNLCGREIPAIDAFGKPAQIEIPWDLPDGSCTATVRSGLFEHGIDINVKRYDPQFGPVIAHEDFRSIVTSSDPARPGEALIAWMGGLGPVDESGRLLRGGFTCRADATDARVEYAGLSPAFPGTYQVNVRVPEGGPFSALTCGWDIDTQTTAPLPVSR
jgi:uncharacterized protein (TIGR03437 family)